MSRIFISYRRADAASYAGRLYDRLIEVFGEDDVFIDVDAIEAGEDFLGRIGREVAACQVFIVLIGNDWLRLTRERMSNSDDYVRFEVVSALDRDIRVIPVLVEGVSMPVQAELPPLLARLSERNAFSLSDLHWRSEVNLLIAAIQRALKEAGQGEEERLEEQRREQERRAGKKWDGQTREAPREERVRAQPRRPSRNILIGGGLCIVAVAVVALVAAGAFSGGGGKASDDRSFVAASTSLFTTSVSKGAQQDPEVTKARGHLKETTWHDAKDPDNTWVLVDAMPNATSTPGDRARRELKRRSAKPGYQQVSFKHTTLSGRDGWEWIYRLDGKPYVDYFLNSCKDAFAVLGSSPPARFSEFKPTFRRVAESLRARSCS